MKLVDTHCHIHSVDYSLSITEVDEHNREAGVEYLICVGTDAADSERAVRFVADRPNSWAAVGQHPHEAKFGREPLERVRALVEADRRSVLQAVEQVQNPMAGDGRRGSARFARSLGEDEEGADRPAGPATLGSQEQAVLGPVTKKLTSQVLGSSLRARDPSFLALPSTEMNSSSTRNGVERRQSKIVAIGECGLDYFYGHSSKEDQEKALRYQIELALEYDLPLTFHVRDAFDDFWPIFDSYQGVRGVLHSFTDNSANFSKAVSRDLYIGVNGIMTFTKKQDQLEIARQIPLDRLVLETDSPFLTPVPLRGKVNEPAHVLLVARFLSDLRQIPLQEVARHTTANARQLFSL